MEEMAKIKTAPAEISFITFILISNSGCIILQIFSMAELKNSALKTAKQTIKMIAESVGFNFK